MTSKIAFFVCLCAFTAQTITGQCLGPYNPNALAINAWEAAGHWGAPLAYGPTPYNAPWPASPYTVEGELIPFAPSNGGGFAVTSSSPIAPTGVRVTSEGAYEGALTVTGNLPFLGAVALDGALPTLGSGATNYVCSNGDVAITSEDFGYPMGPAGYRPDIAGPTGYRPDVAYPAPGYGYNGYGPYY